MWFEVVWDKTFCHHLAFVHLFVAPSASAWSELGVPSWPAPSLQHANNMFGAKQPLGYAMICSYQRKVCYHRGQQEGMENPIDSCMILIGICAIHRWLVCVMNCVVILLGLFQSLVFHPDTKSTTCQQHFWRKTTFGVCHDMFISAQGMLPSGSARGDGISHRFLYDTEWNLCHT